MIGGCGGAYRAPIQSCAWASLLHELCRSESVRSTMQYETHALEIALTGSLTKRRPSPVRAQHDRRRCHREDSSKPGREFRPTRVLSFERVVGTRGVVQGARRAKHLSPESKDGGESSGTFSNTPSPSPQYSHIRSQARPTLNPILGRLARHVADGFGPRLGATSARVRPHIRGRLRPTLDTILVSFRRSRTNGPNWPFLL